MRMLFEGEGHRSITQHKSVHTIIMYYRICWAPTSTQAAKGSIYWPKALRDIRRSVTPHRNSPLVIKERVYIFRPLGHLLRCYVQKECPHFRVSVYKGIENVRSPPPPSISPEKPVYSVVTDLAKLRGKSTSNPLLTAK